MTDKTLEERIKELEAENKQLQKEKECWKRGNGNLVVERDELIEDNHSLSLEISRLDKENEKLKEKLNTNPVSEGLRIICKKIASKEKIIPEDLLSLSRNSYINGFEEALKIIEENKTNDSINQDKASEKLPEVGKRYKHQDCNCCDIIVSKIESGIKITRMDIYAEEEVGLPISTKDFWDNYEEIEAKSQAK